MSLSKTLLIYSMLQDHRRRDGSRSTRSYKHMLRGLAPPLRRATVSELTSLFHILDVNKDDFITFDEFILIKKCMKYEHLHKIYGPSDQSVFNRADYDGDGKISLEEWLRFGKECPPSSAYIQTLIETILCFQYGFSDKDLEAMTRKKLFRFSKRHHLELDACATNEELRLALKKLFHSKRPTVNWYDWLKSFELF